MVVKLFHGRKKARDFGVPRQRRGVVPRRFALCDRKCPVEEVAHVREDLRGSPRLVTNMKAGEVIRGAPQGFAGAVRNGGDGVPKKLSVGIS